MFCIEPLCSIIFSFNLRVHIPISINSFIRYLLITINSPAKVRLVYILLVNGSKHSLLDNIWLVDAVGIGATHRELRTPFLIIFTRSLSQSYILGVIFHISN